MKTLPILTIMALSLFASNLQAGSLNGGKWTPDNCGSKPAVPTIDNTSVEGFNQSVSLLKDWQEQAKAYYGCITKEANTDTSLVADTANKEQAEYRDAVNTINTSITAAKQKLEHK